MCTSEAQASYKTPYVAGSLNVVRKAEEPFPWNTHASVLFKVNRNKHQKIDKMIMPAHTLPQNGCYFASASVWQKAIYILHAPNKFTTTQQRPTVQLSNHQTAARSVISCLLRAYYRIHTAITIILEYIKANQASIKLVKLLFLI